MGRPAKFTGARRKRILSLVAAGASHAAAARAAGVAPSTLSEWLRRGRTGHPEGRYRKFHDDVQAVEADPHHLQALELDRDLPNTVAGDALAEATAMAWSVLEREGLVYPPTKARVTLHDGTPLPPDD